MLVTLLLGKDGSVVDAKRLVDEFAGGDQLLKEDMGEEDIESLLVQQIEFCSTLIINKKDLVNSVICSYTYTGTDDVEASVHILTNRSEQIPTALDGVTLDNINLIGICYTSDCSDIENVITKTIYKDPSGATLAQPIEPTIVDAAHNGLTRILTTPFVGSYDGNNFAVKNMNIEVTRDNLVDYVDNAQTAGNGNGSMLTVGFFGFVGNPGGGEQAVIKNLNVVDAAISTTEIEAQSGMADNESAEYRDSLNLSQAYVGVLAGYIYNTAIEGQSNVVSSNINSSIYCDDIKTTYGGVSAFVGGASCSVINGYQIVSTITATPPGPYPS